jgi:anaerobic selenocysteine-containing dehydrogenase
MSDHQPSQKELPEAPSTAKTPAGISRRGFLKGAGITAAGTALLEGAQGFSREAVASTPKGVKEFGPESFPLTLHINGKEHALQIEPRTTLADALRIQLNMTGTKVSCDRGVCSSCAVLLDRMPVNSCMRLAIGSPPSKAFLPMSRCILCKLRSSGTTPCNVVSALRAWS